MSDRCPTCDYRGGREDIDHFCLDDFHIRESPDPLGRHCDKHDKDFVNCGYYSVCPDCYRADVMRSRGWHD